MVDIAMIVPAFEEKCGIAEILTYRDIFLAAAEIQTHRGMFLDVAV